MIDIYYANGRSIAYLVEHDRIIYDFYLPGSTSFKWYGGLCLYERVREESINDSMFRGEWSITRVLDLEDFYKWIAETYFMELL